MIKIFRIINILFIKIVKKFIISMYNYFEKKFILFLFLFYCLQASIILFIKAQSKSKMVYPFYFFDIYIYLIIRIIYSK